MKIAWKKLCRTLSAFRSARGGNVAITFAIATLPILGFVGAAVDYSRANSVKAAMQTSLDSTALMLAKEAATDTEDQLKANALKYFTALFVKPEAKDVQVHVTYTTDGGSKVTVTANATMPADFTKILGYDTFNLMASSTSKWGTNRLRVALVLDNTGSMADAGKIGALKTATKGLLAQLQGAVTQAGDVYVSIIPFVKDVNMGATNASADWIYWGSVAQDPSQTDTTSWDASHGTCTSNTTYNNNRSRCFTRGGSCSNNSFSTQSTCTANGNCSVGGATSQTTCNSNGTCSISGNNTQTACNSAGTCSLSGYSTQPGCQGAGTCSISGNTTQTSCQSAHVCSKSQYTSKSPCQNNGGTWMAGVWTSNPGTWSPATWTPATFTAYIWTPGTWVADHSAWHGCVMDRGFSSGPDATYNFDTNASPPDPVTADKKVSSLYTPEAYNACPQAVRGLSDDWTAMNSLVDNMSPNGSTNQAIGLQSGWQSLVGGGPFSVPALDPLYQYTQVIILLTDGLNTQDRWYGDGSTLGSTDDAKIDARQQILCDNVKGANITLYTIQVNTGGDPTSTLLQNCASTSDKFYLLTSADQMTATFNTIGTNLTKLRVAQ
jgi:Flp pilus assembly protein TadG